eukprot:CAMPEP_0172310142 /NCGR_PEP_ID=MMETSP1058-20130122/11315_1 /TAXON_ID=83371 /ORGANISM="Detonula confervacea, Strain CCMP 353" /LENGTH=170 /DNA_ID=CAMNT_0013022909 /DNA_START=116 /DNA_END=628 /DNA_ORIENTATION=+
MVHYSELRTATLRTIFASAYAANFVVASLHFGKAYLEILSSIIIMVLSLCMLTITLQQPEKLMVYFEMTGKEVVFTWRMRSVADIIQILFLLACGMLGEIMAIVTGVLLLLVFSLAQKRPDIFRELFRKHAGDPAVGDESDGAAGEASSRYEEAIDPSSHASAVGGLMSV